MKLSREQFEKLNAFAGYGDQKQADVIYFGMEEGLGGKDIEPNIMARCEYYGKDSRGWFNPTTWKDGYFERCGSEAAEKMAACLTDLGLDNPADGSNGNIQSLEFMSRLSLFLKEPEKPWFALKGEQPELYDRITAYWRNARLFHADEKIKTALFDWKPLPRANVSDWPYEVEDDLFLKKEYEDAFDFKEHSNPFLTEMVQKRLELLGRVVSTETFSTLIAFGGRTGKVRILTEALSRVTKDPIAFQEVVLPESKQTISVAELTINGKKRLFICSPFFDSKVLSRKGLEELAQYIHPYFSKNEILV
ncbi:hypothetical protein BGM25_03535 [Bacillus sp. FJAT-29953]|nr:hypothetical protein [Bacillus sp. FJAT-29953]